MQNFRDLFGRADTVITRWMARYGIVILRISLGVIFFWFGFLKFFPDVSPAQDLAARTIDRLTLGLVPTDAGLLVLAAWETAIGLGLIVGRWMRVVLFLLFAQMVGTVTPVFLFPTEVFARIPWAPTLEGQYIIKNLVLVSAALVIGATVRGGFLSSEPASHAPEGAARPRSARQ